MAKCHFRLSQTLVTNPCHETLSRNPLVLHCSGHEVVKVRTIAYNLTKRAERVQLPKESARRSQAPVARKPSHPTDSRHINTRELFLLLRANSPCSRADLARLSGLSEPTVSRAINYLESQEVVRSLGAGDSGGGRKPTLLSLNPQYAYVAGVDVTYSNIALVLADLEGRQIGKWSSDLASLKTPQRVVNTLVAALDSLLRQHSIAKKKLYSLCAAVPGIVDPKTQRITATPFLPGWEHLPLRKMLEDALGVPIIVENESNLSALGERSLGAAKDHDNFVFLSLAKGVGAGIFIKGNLHGGATGGAGEIGHMQIPGAPRAPLSAHLPGSLEQIVGARGIEQTWRKIAQAATRRKSPTATEILDLAACGDRKAIQTIERTAKALGDAIVNISVLLDPTMIVFGGMVGRSQILFDHVLRQLRQRQYNLEQTQLCLSALGEDAAMTGALKIALQAAETRLLSSID
jgi:glucokinase